MAIYCDDQVMKGTKEVLQYLHLDKDFLPRVKRKMFELSHKKRDGDGRIRSKKSISGKPEFSVFVKELGYEVKVRYAITQRKDKDQNFIYTPGNLTIEPAEDGTVIIANELEFLFWLIRPMCKQSPFREPNKKHHYEYMDKDAQATEEMRVEQIRVDAMQIIIGENAWSDAKLKQLAKGMNFAGVDDMTPMVIKKTLKDYALRNPVQFYNSANSREVIFSGKIQEAMDAGILVVKNHLGMKRWYLGEDEILPLQFGEDEVRAVKAYLSQNWHLHADTIQASLEGRTVSSNLNNPLNDEHFDKIPESTMPAAVEPEVQAAADGKETQVDRDAKTKEDYVMDLLSDPKLKDKAERYAKIDITDPKITWQMKRTVTEFRPYLEALKTLNAPPGPPQN